MTQLRVRARAVDMLGRQQIAGIPTAIHELFKNAHDAYAERVEADYFRQQRILILRDDGYGMTRQDVENRWLTLGTESRLNANHTSTTNEWRGPKNLPKRAIMGEKGIGRLAIAVIAPVTILMTRASRENGLQNLVVGLIHWGLFEQPGIDISAIDIPLAEFTGGTLPKNKDIVRLVEAVKENLNQLEDNIPPDEFLALNASLNRASSIDPEKLDSMLNRDRDTPLSLAGYGYGTQFILLPVAPELDDDIDNATDKESSKLERNLLGFSNFMASSDPVIKTEFRDHSLNHIDSLIGPKNFFSNEDFEKTDQYFEGRFDEYGQFVGTVSIYGKPRQFICNWTDGKGRMPRCGPFTLHYGYIQGNARDSSLSPEDWVEMSEKGFKIGGLYIYRNGIRILPYGNSDIDWLDIEKRRTLSAQDWFFSYRRGFGYVAIDHTSNSTLIEKAGREGFRENLAYRDFRSILINFFRQLAYEFFRKSSPQGEDFNETKDQYQKQAELLKKQKEKADKRRKDFQNELDKFFELYNESYFDHQSNELRHTLKNRLEELSFEADPSIFADTIRKLEQEKRSQYRILLNKSSITLPRGLALTNRLKKDWLACEVAIAQINEEILEPLSRDINTLFSEARKGKIAASEKRDSALQDIIQEKDNIVRDLMTLRRETSQAMEQMQNSVKVVMKEEFTELRTNIEKLIDEFTKRSAEKPEQSEQLRSEIESKIRELKQSESAFFDSLKRQMNDLAGDIQDRDTLDDRFAALESKNQLLEEQIEFYSDFAQMGMSVGILQHEFEGAARGIREAMAALKPWADKNPPLTPIYSGLRSHIEHLDGYLKALDPLGRRMHRATIELSGNEILQVIRNVFSHRLDDSSIELQPSYAFRGFKVICKSSALLGAFINIIDNAIYWLDNRTQGTKYIILDADKTGFLISNNGPGIEERIRERIFHFGETTKPGGRGMGLAITRESLRREGFDIFLSQSGANIHPVFKISPKDDQGEE